MSEMRSKSHCLPLLLVQGFLVVPRLLTLSLSFCLSVLCSFLSSCALHVTFLSPLCCLFMLVLCLMSGGLSLRSWYSILTQNEASDEELTQNVTLSHDKTPLSAHPCLGRNLCEHKFSFPFHWGRSGQREGAAGLLPRSPGASAPTQPGSVPLT